MGQVAEKRITVNGQVYEMTARCPVFTLVQDGGTTLLMLQRRNHVKVEEAVQLGWLRKVASE